MEAVQVRAVVSGVVQGVGFRYFVIQRARDLDLVGYVRNRRDGSVEVVAEGPRERLERLADDVREGPRHGLVRDVQLEWNEATGGFDRFEVDFGSGRGGRGS